MKKRKYFNYNFIIFLYAYLRQIDLSLARSRDEPLIGLKIFYKNQINPELVINFLVSNSLVEKSLNSNFVISKKSFSKINRFKFLIYKLIKRNNFLNYTEIIESINELLLFNDVLKSNKDIDGLAIEKLRINIANLSTIIDYRLFKVDSNKAMYVEHYKQSDNIITNPIANFIIDFELHDKPPVVASKNKFNG